MTGALTAAVLFTLAQPVVSGELSFEAPLIARYASPRNEAAVAFDGSNFVVVYEDGRCSSNCIFAVRVSAAGVNIDPTGIMLSEGRAPHGDARVACRTERCLVAWASGSEVQYLVLDTATGTPGPVMTVPFSTAVLELEVARFGEGFALATTAGRVAFNRITAAGVNLDSTGATVSTHAMVGESAVVEVGGHALVVWEDFSCGGVCTDLVGRRMSLAGVPVDAVPFPVISRADEQRQPRLASDGTTAGLIWTDGPAATSQIRLARIQGTTVLEPNGVQLSTGTVASLPSVTWDGRDFVGFFHQGGAVIRRMNVATAALDPGIFSLSGVDVKGDLGVAAAGHLVGAAWVTVAGINDVVFRRIDTTSPTTVTQVGSGLSPNVSANSQRNVVIAYNGSIHWAAWIDDRTPSAIYATRLTIGGSAITNSTVVASSTGVTRSGLQIGCSLAGTCWLVWEELGIVRRVMGARLLSTGAVSVLNGAPLTTDTAAQFQPDLACVYDQCLAVWRRTGTPGPVVGTRLSLASDTPLDAQLDLFPAAQPGSRAWVFPWEPNFLVVRSASNDAFALRALADGGVEGPAGGVALTTPALDVGAHCMTNECSVFSRTAANEIRFINTQPHLGLASVPPGASLGFSSGSPLEGLAAAFDGTKLYAVYSHDSDIWMTPATRDAGLEAAQTFIVSEFPTAEAFPEVVTGPGAAMLVTYERDVPESPFGAVRARGRLVNDTSTMGRICTSSATCGTFTCVDGVCCDSPCGNGDPTDCQACSVAAGGVSNGKCFNSVAEFICRPPTSLCDTPEKCTGTTTVCPANVLPTGDPACGLGGQCNLAGVCLLADGGVYVPDAGSDAPDSGFTDAGAIDAGSSDGGASSDAGSNDGGEPDAGAESDAGLTDGGASGEDAGTPGVRLQLEVGCGCSAVPPSALFALAFIVVARRRRQPSR